MISIIRRRELDPLLIKAWETLENYEKAADCIVSVLGPDNQLVEESRHPKANFFCRLCRRFSADTGKKWAQREFPCTGMHMNAIEESHRLGGSFIYTCPLGFIFWTSPIYSGKRFAGSLIASGVLAIDRQEAAKKIFEACRREKTMTEIGKYLEGIPTKSYSDVKALAQLMLVCAEQISCGIEDPAETTARIIEQESGASSSLYLVKNTPIGSAPGSAYPVDKERTLSLERLLLAALRRGDTEAGKKILGEMLDILTLTSPVNFKFFQLRAIELVVLLSRAAAGTVSASENKTGDNTEYDALLAANDRYLKKIEESRSVEELIETLHIIIERMSGKIFSFQGVRHSSALRKAERFIWENYTRKISLGEIAGASGLSAPYFSTIFKSEMGENLSNYLNRLRVEKAAAMLVETELNLNEIAGTCGFEDQSWFSKMFKNYTGLSPGKFREKGGNYAAVTAGGDLSRKEA
ncbi:MAG: helix-turn-helix domain-containing protein [Treponema sp.]|jgi:AraC-like DNA-binding protein/ligand-binding sensor protein|nr:helix-turn-helix domain-containing protein [Treponema sp.]